MLERFVAKMHDKNSELNLINKTMRRNSRAGIILTDKLGLHGAAVKQTGHKPGWDVAHAFSPKGAGDASFQTGANFAAIRRCLCPDAQSFEFGKKPKLMTTFRTKP